MALPKVVTGTIDGIGVVMNLNARNRLSLVLWFVAIHSCLIWLALTLLPPSGLTFFGLRICSERFFPVQAGVFHLVMATMYAWAALGLLRVRELIRMAVVAKCIATVFLVTYYLVIDRIWVVLAAGIVDGLMAALIWHTLAAFERQPRETPPDC